MPKHFIVLPILIALSMFVYACGPNALPPTIAVTNVNVAETIKTASAKNATLNSRWEIVSVLEHHVARDVGLSMPDVTGVNKFGRHRRARV